VRQAIVQEKHSLLCVLLVDKDVTVSCLTSLQVHDHLVGIVQRSLLDPRLDLLISCEFEHLLDLTGRADGAATKLDAVRDEREGVHRREVAAVRSAAKELAKFPAPTLVLGSDLPDLDECALRLEQAKVVGQGHLLARDRAHDEVESLLVLRSPVLIRIGGDVLVCAELENVVLLVCLTRDTDDAICPKSLGEKDTEMAQAADTNNADGLARTAAVGLQWREDSDTAAEHGSCVGGAQALWDLEDEVRVGAVVVCISAVGFANVVGVD
jgi:hypothetical protein